YINDTMVLENLEETVFGFNTFEVYSTAPTELKTLCTYRENDSMNLHDELVNTF
ncbi:182_t:CDS:1, partial [Diversispora eburnea]